MRYKFCDYYWPAIKPMLANKQHPVADVNDR